MGTIKDARLSKFKNELAALYGNNLARVVLFGSRARGDNAVDSDYDVAVFLNNMPNRWAEIDRLAGLRLPYLEQNAVFFDVMSGRRDMIDERHRSRCGPAAQQSSGEIIGGQFFRIGIYIQRKRDEQRVGGLGEVKS